MTDISTSNNLNSQECKLIDACGENVASAHKTCAKDTIDAVERTEKEVTQAVNEAKSKDNAIATDVCSSTTEKLMAKKECERIVHQITDVSTCDSSESNAFATESNEPLMRLSGSIDDAISAISGDIRPSSGSYSRNTIFRKLQRSPRSLKLFPKNQDDGAPNGQHNWKSAFSKLFRLKRKTKEVAEPESSEIFTNIPLTSSTKYDMQTDSKTKSLGKLFRRPRSEMLPGQGGSLGRSAAPVMYERNKGWSAFLNRFRHKSHPEVLDKLEDSPEANRPLDGRASDSLSYTDSKPLTIFEPNAKTATTTAIN